MYYCMKTQQTLTHTGFKVLYANTSKACRLTKNILYTKQVQFSQLSTHGYKYKDFKHNEGTDEATEEFISYPFQYLFQRVVNNTNKALN